MNQRLKVSLFGLLLGLSATSGLSSDARTPQTFELAAPRNLHTASLLTNGNVLVVGGSYQLNRRDMQFPLSSEIYDAAGRKWSRGAPTGLPRSLHAATLLDNGSILVTGGMLPPNTAGNTAEPELYDPGTGRWTRRKAAPTARAAHTATLLAGGRVLVVGGFSADMTKDLAELASAEIYDPAADEWTETKALPSPRCGHTATLLRSGKVLVAGGIASSRCLSDACLYDPGTKTWTATEPMPHVRAHHTATLLADGRVLVAGGAGSGSGFQIFSKEIDECELYDESTGKWTATKRLRISRSSHTATLLLNGKVLVTGGQSGREKTDSCELYDPTTQKWKDVRRLQIPRCQHTATLLSDGTVLVVGGSANWGPIAEAEVVTAER